MAELTALKPGNVHIFADGHGMVVQDFIKSAEVVAAVIAQPDLAVGQRILASVEATWKAVGCNTNLGIILLAAPLIQAAMLDSTSGLQANLYQVLNNLTVHDAELAYQAIKVASPGGLGEADQHDVHHPPDITLLEAMQVAQNRDMIARQYASGYADIFGFGLDRYQKMISQWQNESWAVTSIFLGFLATFNDSHIARKYGDTKAEAIKNEAFLHDQAMASLQNPKLYQRALLQYDGELKMLKVNPGTSADMTVATVLTLNLVGLNE